MQSGQVTKPAPVQENQEPVSRIQGMAGGSRLRTSSDGWPLGRGRVPGHTDRNHGVGR